LAAKSTSLEATKGVVQRATAPAGLGTPFLGTPQDEKNFKFSQSASGQEHGPVIADDKKLTVALGDRENDRSANQLVPPQQLVVAKESPTPSQRPTERSKGLLAGAGVGTNPLSTITLIAIVVVFGILAFFALKTVKQLGNALATWLAEKSEGKKTLPTTPPVKKLAKKKPIRSAKPLRKKTPIPSQVWTPISPTNMVVLPNQSQESNAFKHNDGTRRSAVRRQPQA
jgi:hypothetical protein